MILLDVSMNSYKNIKRIVPKCCPDILHVRTIEGDKAKKLSGIVPSYKNVTLLLLQLSLLNYGCLGFTYLLGVLSLPSFLKAMVAAEHPSTVLWSPIFSLYRAGTIFLPIPS